MKRITQRYALPEIGGLEVEIHPFGGSACIWIVDPGDVQALHMSHGYSVKPMPDGRLGIPYSRDMGIIEECDE